MLPRPKKNFALFSINEAIGFFPKQIFKGEMGKLPIFMAVNVGYDPEDPDPFMYPYESQEVGRLCLSVCLSLSLSLSACFSPVCMCVCFNMMQIRILV